MNEEKRIIQLINEKVNTIKAEKKEIKATIFNELNQIEPIIEELKRVELNHEYLVNISNDKLILLEKFCFNFEIKELIVCKELLKNKNFNFSQKYVNKLNTICKNIISNFNTIKLEMLKNETKIKKISDYQNSLLELKKKVIDGCTNITAQDLQEYIDLFKHLNISQKEIIELIKYITYKYISSAEQIQTGFEIEELKETNLSEESLINLFNLYGYSFYDLGANTTEICRYGNIENIKSILEILKNNDINLNKKIGNKKIIEAKSKQLTEILLKSNGDIVLGIIEIAKKINLFKDGKIDFVYLLETPSRFLSRKKMYQKKNSIGGEGPGIIDAYGCYEDFIANVKLLKSKYEQSFNDEQFLNKVFKKCDSVFNHPHQQVLNVIKIYDLYNIEPKYYLNSLSGVNSINQAEVFDLALELDIMDYIKDNMSRAMLKADDKLFEKIVIAQRNNIPNIFKKNLRKTLTGEKTCLYFNKSYVNECITYQKLKFEKFNIKKMFNDNEIRIFEEFDKIISKQDNDDFNLALNEISTDDNSLLKSLEKYKDNEDPNIYIINNIRISRIKALRLYTTLKIMGVEPSIYSLMYILTKNSYITQEEFEKLYDTINNLISNKEKKV